MDRRSLFGKATENKSVDSREVIDKSQFEELKELFVLKMLFRAVGIVMLTVILINLFLSPIGAEERGTEKEIRLFLRECDGEEDILVLEVCLESDNGVCALLCDLEYDAERYIYLSGGSVDEKINFKAIDFGSVVGFLLDSGENSNAECVLARLYFKRIGQGKARFTLNSRDNALGVGDNLEICSYQTRILSDTSVPGDNTDKGDSNELPRLVSLNMGSEKIVFSVKSPHDCFAAGVRLFFIDLSGGGEHFGVFVTGIIKRGGMFAGEHTMPQGNYAVIVTALGYSARELIRGEKRIEMCE